MLIFTLMLILARTIESKNKISYCDSNLYATDPDSDSDLDATDPYNDSDFDNLDAADSDPDTSQNNESAHQE